MVPFSELATLAMALSIPVAVALSVAYLTRRLTGRRGELPRATEELAEALGLPVGPLEGAELAGLAGAGLLPSDATSSPALRWEAPDATFRALLILSPRGLEGMVIVVPHGSGLPTKPRLADFSRRSPRDLARVPLPGDLRQTAADVSVSRLGERLVVRRSGVSTPEELEKLLMAACAILEAQTVGSDSRR